MKWQVVPEGDVVVWREEYTSKAGTKFINFYGIIASKDREGHTVKCYLTLKFPKDVDIPDGSKIRVLEAFIAFNAYLKKGEKYPYIFIKNYELVDIGKIPEENKAEMDELDDYSFV